MANPQTIDWIGPDTYEDGTPYGQADHGGYELELNGLAAIAVPVAWNVSNAYSLPIAGLPNLRQGNNAIRMRTVAANGQVSDYTGVVTFPYLSIPKAPTALTVV
jgi:hypothetical protein